MGWGGVGGEGLPQQKKCANLILILVRFYNDFTYDYKSYADF